MKRKLGQILTLVLTTTLLSCCTSEYEIYLSPKGNDNAQGTMADPIASPFRAIELAKDKVGKIPVTIYLFGGNYSLTEPLRFGVNDGGTEKAPVHWKALPGEKPIFSGGISIKNWNIEDDGSWSANLPLNYNGNFRSFYVNDKRATRARFPDKDYLKVDEAGKDNKTNFFFKKGDFPNVENVKNLELVFLHDWSITRIGVKSIDWITNRLTTIDSIGARFPSFFTITNWEKHPRYYLENAIEFCDSPGEWYCDYGERKVYYRPLPNERIEESEGVIPIATKLITIAGTKEKHVEFIKFEGITFAHTEWELPSRGYCGIQACMFDDRESDGGRWDKIPATIELDLADNCRFDNCNIKHTGGSGVWMRENCLNCEISECHIYDISGNGVDIGERRDRLVNGIPWWQAAPEQVSKNNKISNSLIEDCGKQFYGAVGIWGGLVENTIIDHNEIRNLPYTGISVGWMWNPTPTPCRENTTNANYIHHVMKTLSDGGGIYCLGLQPDSRITNNLIHDVSVNAGRAESNGMFLDEGIKDLLVENNIVYNIARSPLRFHKAFLNTVSKNVFVCGDGIPPIRYNRTSEEDIKKIDNTILSQSTENDLETLREIIEKRFSEIGPRREF